jgi:glycosyltransferase involved in cell wall biosynthesis
MPPRHEQSMRIAFVNSYYYPDEVGGAERSLRHLAESAVTHGHSCAVFTTGARRETAEYNGVRVERFATAQASPSGSSVAKLLWHASDTYRRGAAADIAAAIERFNPLVAQTNNLSGISVALWSQLAQREIPIAHTLRDYYLMCPNTARFRGGRPCSQRCGACRVLGYPRLTASRHVDTVIGNSHFILAEHLAAGGFSRAQRAVIYNGYRPAEPAPVRTSVPAARSLAIGYIGRLAPSKGLELLLRSFRRLVPTLTRPVCLHIAGVGESSYVSHLRGLAQGLPVRFRGHMEPQEFYQTVDLTVVPSLWDEPLARVLFESFAHGIPVVSSAKGGSTELVVPGRTGWLFDVQEPTSLELSLLVAVRSCAGPEYRTLSAACLTESRRFLPEQTLAMYTQVLQMTARRSQGPG